MTEEPGVSAFSCSMLGALLETVNHSNMMDVFWDLQVLERRYYHLIHNCIEVEILDLCENIITVYYVKKYQTVDQRNVSLDYGDAIHRYLEGLPIAYRLEAFKEISCIVERHATK